MTIADPLAHLLPEVICNNYIIICLGTVENHGNTEIMETVIFVKCRDLAKMSCLLCFLAKMLCFYVFTAMFCFFVSVS